MSHLIPPSIRPRLGRTRSHTSPSPRRPSNLEDTERASIDVDQQRSVTYGHTVSPEPPPSGTVGANTRPESRLSTESQRHTRLPHLHIHTHLPNLPGHHHFQKQPPAPATAANHNSKPHVTSRIAGDRPSSSSKQTSSPSPVSTSPVASREHGNHEIATLSPTGRERQSLRRTLSNRSTSRYNVQTDFSIGSHLLSPVALPTAQGLRGSSPSRGQGRPRAISDQSRPGLSREPTLSSAKTPEEITNAVATALERGNRQRQDNIASASQAHVEKLGHRAKEAEEEMRQRLDGVTKEGLEITRRLDYTYYNLLERIGCLTDMVAKFQSLGGQVGHLEEKLHRDMRGLGEETSEGIKGLRKAAEGRRQEKVYTLEERMKKGRERARALGERLEVARRQLADFEKREEEWRRRTRRKIKVAWVLSGLLIFLISVFLGVRANHASQMGFEDDWMEDIVKAKAGIRSSAPSLLNNTATDRLASSRLEERVRDVYIPQDVIDMLSTACLEDTRDQERHFSAAGPSESPQEEQEMASEERMRVFDEL